ncbi:cilia- and flagella-associated protein 43-like [Polistes fuscatus]|uniref:cilia- and flagella-associated protein 43-like n=1 Tax=Polistes fuscatus TaxID=30207 RepID=UPI001CA82A29|nr:cilia- and flagella-associated protein 43-like [Polistes fuscatus]
MDYSITQTKWVKFGEIRDFVFVGKDILATASGLHVRFFNMNTRENKIEIFNDQTRGFGVSTLSGHPTVPVFSVADKHSNPTIRVFTYPRIQKISSCTNMEESNGYLSCTFAGTDYLLGLTSFPNFQLVLWQWQTGDKVFVINTELKDLIQTIACSPFSPHAIVQFALITGKLAVYRMCVCSKIVTLYPIKIKSQENKLTSVCWTIDGNLLFCDEFCKVWSMSADGSSQNILIEGNSKSKAHKNRLPFIVTFKDGLLLVNTLLNEIAFYRKFFNEDSMESWQKLWFLNNKEHSLPVRAKSHNQRDSVLIYDECGRITEISVLNDHVPRLEILYTDDVKYKELLVIASRSTYFAAIDEFQYLNIIDPFTGKIESKLALKLHGQVVCAKAHPKLPIIFTSSFTGNCLFIDVFTNTPKILTCFHLHKMFLDKMKFSSEGKLLGIANSRDGRIFIIGKNLNQGDSSFVGIFMKKHQINHYVIINTHSYIPSVSKVLDQTKRNQKGKLFTTTKILIADFLIYDQTNNSIKILILLITNKNVMIGNKLILYTCKLRDNLEKNIECVIDLLTSFKSLQYGPKRNIDIIGIPYLSKQLHRMEIKNDFNDVTLTEALPAMHELKNIEVDINCDSLITFGYDGLIVIRNTTNLRMIYAIFMAHHRNENGIKSAKIISETIISLGRNGDLIANKLCRRYVQLKTISINVDSRFLNSFNFIFESNKLYNKGLDTYLENIQKIQWENEMNEEMSTRHTIFLELNKLKSKIKELLDLNEKETILTRLPISLYDLDEEYRKYRIKKADLERKELKRRYDEEIEARNKVCLYLRKIFWDPERVHACCLKSIFGEIIVKNYPLKTITKNTKHETNSIDRFYESATNDERLLLSGTSTHNWINNETLNLTHQLKRSQDLLLNGFNKSSFFRNREYLLMNHFNECFNKMRLLKEQKMEVGRVLEEKLKHYTSEINVMFEKKCTIESVTLPVWHHSEIPDYVITIEDKEILGISYIHPRKESSNDKYKNINEYNLQLYSKDYGLYKEALERMMYGVLELRWEDEIKKDIPKPTCLVKNKSPSKYTPKDIKALESYKSKMERLQLERKKYRSILDAERIEINDKITKCFMSFDEKLKNFKTKKIAIDSSILQEKLLRLREMQRIHHIRDEVFKITHFKENTIAKDAEKVQELVQDCLTFETIVKELKNRYENLIKREKGLEGKFRSEFGDLKQLIIEHLFRYYKKRPRIGYLTCTSITYLTELGKCVIGNNKSEILPVECSNFLRNLQSLDSIPENVSTLIDDAHWRTMCRLRRLKIEIEIKVRCCIVELAEGEQTLIFYQRNKQAAQSKFNRSKAELDKREKEFDRYVENKEIQLVMKMGQVEVPLRGQGFKDFTDVVLISRQAFLSTNDEIKKTDNKKLTAMMESVDLRKKISHQKWRHEYLRHTLKYLQEELKNLREIKITKDLQKYLGKLPTAGNPRNEYEDIEQNSRATAGPYEKLLDIKRNRLEKITKDIEYWRIRNIELTNKIENLKIKNRKLSSQTLEPLKKKNDKFRRNKLFIIMKRTELDKKIKENYDELLMLHSRLESLRLRIYPTLRFNKLHFA